MIIRLIKIITKVSVFSFIGLLFNVFMSYKFLSLWIHPQVGDIEIIVSLIVLMIFEFFMIHSGLFFSIIGGRSSWKDWLKGILFFGLFAVIYNNAVSNNFILIIYCSMVLNRMLSGILNREKISIEKELNIATFYTMIYIGLLVVIALCSSFIPKFGLTTDFLTTENYIILKPDYDLLSMPHVAMCFGALYYLIFTFVEINNIIRGVKTSLPQIESAIRQ